MQSIYENIFSASIASKKLLAILIDPEKVILENISDLVSKITASSITHILVGGSTDINNNTENVVLAIKQLTKLPIVLFPGDYSQITPKANGILFLSLLSGRNPEYLIEQQIKSIPYLNNTNLEVIPTGYLLLDGGVKTAVQRVSKTSPISQNNIDEIVHTSLAGEYSGKKLIYLEAGSGAAKTVSTKIIEAVKSKLKIPLIVGGGIKTIEQLNDAYNAGADLVVIGTAFEKDEAFFNELKK